MSDATGVAEAILGLPGFRVREMHGSAAEVVIVNETLAQLVGCPGCGVVARAHDQMAVEYRGRGAHRRRWDDRHRLDGHVKGAALASALNPAEFMAPLAGAALDRGPILVWGEGVALHSP